MRHPIGLSTLENKANYSDVNAILLAAGLGTRLTPFTEIWPKCLMPIQKTPLLQLWLDDLSAIGIGSVLVNLHAHSSIVQAFLKRPKYEKWVQSAYERELLGTAGTVRQNAGFIAGKTTFLAHADNLCVCDLNSFFDFHRNRRPKDTVITMMTFTTDTPKSCGIIGLDSEGIVRQFHEKVENPPGNTANAAIYLIEPEVTDWIVRNKSVSDFSNQVIPQFMGKIATWHNDGIMRDIGTPSSLAAAQGEVKPRLTRDSDRWFEEFLKHPVHSMLEHQKQ